MNERRRVVLLKVIFSQFVEFAHRKCEPDHLGNQSLILQNRNVLLELHPHLHLQFQLHLLHSTRQSFRRDHSRNDLRVVILQLLSVRSQAFTRRIDATVPRNDYPLHR